MRREAEPRPPTPHHKVSIFACCPCWPAWWGLRLQSGRKRGHDRVIARAQKSRERCMLARSSRDTKRAACRRRARKGTERVTPPPRHRPRQPPHAGDDATPPAGPRRRPAPLWPGSSSSCDRHGVRRITCCVHDLTRTASARARPEWGRRRRGAGGRLGVVTAVWGLSRAVPGWWCDAFPLFWARRRQAARLCAAASSSSSALASFWRPGNDPVVLAALATQIGSRKPHHAGQQAASEYRHFGWAGGRSGFSLTVAFLGRLLIEIPLSRRVTARAERKGLGMRMDRRARRRDRGRGGVLHSDTSWIQPLTRRAASPAGNDPVIGSCRARKERHRGSGQAGTS